MSEHNPTILIAGAGASQELLGNRLTDPALVPGDIKPDVIFYDPNPGARLRVDLPHLHAGTLEGRVRLMRELPDRKFDAAIIANPSQYHAEATLAILNHQETMSPGAQPPFMVIEKPVVTSYDDLARIREIEGRIQPCSIVNEPYFLMESLRQLVARINTRPDIPLAEAFVWSSKDRLTVNPHGNFRRYTTDIYTTELPHLHGAASWIAGQVLGVDALQENIYYKNVGGVEYSDGIYMRFQAGEAMIHVAQGLGTFVMDQYGNMLAHPNPPRTRKLALRFADQSSVVLDIEPAFPFTGSGKAAKTIAYQRNKNGKTRVVGTVEDPRQNMARYILRRIQDPTLPNLPGLSLSEALDRTQALLDLKNNAETQSDLKVGRHPSQTPAG